MNPVEQALWYIENRFAGELSLDDVSAAAGVSRFHLSRAFVLTTGSPVMTYVRARRLSEAAKTLATGAPDILDVALSAGYGSHEAFTRAFRDLFGQTPEQVREYRSLQNLVLQEPIRMTTPPHASPVVPTFAEGKALLIAGISEHYGCGPGAGIPAQWQRFGPFIGSVPGEVYGTTYGVIHNSDDEGGYDYMCGVEVADFSRIPVELHRLRIAPQTYAVFEHKGHVSSISATIQAIWTAWLPSSDHDAVDAPSFERYGLAFDPQTGFGGVEFWLPVKRRIAP